MESIVAVFRYMTFKRVKDKHVGNMNLHEATQSRKETFTFGTPKLKFIYQKSNPNAKLLLYTTQLHP